MDFEFVSLSRLGSELQSGAKRFVDGAGRHGSTT